MKYVEVAFFCYTISVASSLNWTMWVTLFNWLGRIKVKNFEFIELYISYVHIMLLEKERSRQWIFQNYTLKKGFG